jgi:hypothetical protein
MSGRERALLIILGLAAVGAAGFFLLTSLGGEEEQQAAPTPVTSPPVLPATPGTEAGEAPTEPPRMFRFFGGRDPFVPLLVAAPGAGGVGTAPATTGTTTVEPAPQGEEQEVQGEAGTVPPKMPTVVEVVDENTVDVDVDGKTYRVDEGEDFARTFRVASVEGGCARFLFGDQSFTVCEGGAPK